VRLAEALARLAPPAAAQDEQEAEIRKQALEIVYGALQKIARRVVVDPDLAEDIACEVAVCLVDGGRRDRRSLPATDSRAEAYLCVAVRNHEIDYWRKTRRHVDVADIPEPGIEPDFSLVETDPAETDALLVNARTLLYERAVPEIAANGNGRGDPLGFELAVTEIRELYHGRTTVEEILVKSDGRCSSSGRNRLYKRHQRVRERLLAELPVWLDRARLPERLDTTVRSLANVELAPRVDRRDR
jgi:DNA-directed RNA polymerase specialized sigma24 family protein